VSPENGSSIFREARRGSPEAINALFERYGQRLHLLIRARLGRHLRRRLESRDILQVTLLKAFQGLERFEGSGSRSLMAWLGTIAVDEIREQATFHRRQKRDAARDVTLKSGLDPVARQVHGEVSRLRLRDEVERLIEALDELTEPHREVILLRSFEELSFKEIAQRLGKSPDACRMLFARAKAALALKM
jgi:RNA polymerase sigma-70 factor (ECF subfamily)